MSAVLPWILMVAAAAVLIAALAAFWQSLRAAFGVASIEQARGIIESEERAALRDEKASLLTSIRDLELDHDADKISDADFERLNRRLRNRARKVLQMLDEDVHAYRPKAEKLLRKALADSQSAPYRSAGGEPEPSGQSEPPGGEATAAADAEPETRACAQCSTQNDPDAVFCKKCGARLAAEGQEEP